MDTSSVVLTVLGPDRPGLVDEIARAVAEHGANWLESRMARLAGQFAGILRVEAPADRAGALAAALRSLGEGGLEAVVSPDATPTYSAAGPLLLLDLVGVDHPGIVRAISGVLAAQGVNVEELQTETSVSPNFGQPVFRATARLRLPPGADRARLREALEAVAADLVVELTLAAEGA